MKVTCTNCGGDHPKWDCKRPAKKSTAVLMETHSALTQPAQAVARHQTKSKDGELSSVGSKYQASPVDTISEPKVLANAVPQRTGAAPQKDTVSLAPNTIQKRKRGRPNLKNFNKKAYNAAYMAKKRARLKAEREAAK